jgi:hypothetical protein
MATAPKKKPVAPVMDPKKKGMPMMDDPKKKKPFPPKKGK